jgi:hypothetical protein
MEVFLSENVPIIQDFYVGPLCNKPRYTFYPNDEVIEEQIIIIQSWKQDCAIWLNMENGSVYWDPNATF